MQDFTTAKIHSIHRSSADLAGVTRKGYEREGVEIEQSDRVYDVIGEHNISLHSILNRRVNTAHDLTYAKIESHDPSYKRPQLPFPAPDQQNQSVTLPPVSSRPAPIKPPTPHDTISEPSVGEGDSTGEKDVDKKLNVEVTQDQTYAEIEIDPTYKRPPLPTQSPDRRVKPPPIISPKPAPRKPPTPYDIISQTSNSKCEPFQPSVGEGESTEVKDGGVTQDPTYAKIKVDPTYKRPPLPTPATLVYPKPAPRKPPTHSNTFSAAPDTKSKPSPTSPGEGGSTGVKGAAGRKQSVGSAGNSGGYQALVKLREPSESGSYVTLGPNSTTTTSPGDLVVTGSKSRQAMLSSANRAVTPAGDSTTDNNSGDIIRNLIGRIESLEQQVKALTDKVEQLSNTHR